MSGTHSEARMDTAVGASPYSPWLLWFYDYFILGLSATYLWQCPCKVLTSFFNSHISSSTRRLLDVGVGTGYHLANAPLDSQTEVVLLDLNENSLRAARDRVEAAHPQVKCTGIMGDVYNPSDIAEPNIGGKFDVISLMWLLHCIPGPTSRKVDMIVDLSRQVLSPEGVLFASTILGESAEHNFVGSYVMRLYNRKGIFSNAGDSVEGFIAPLKRYFREVEYTIVGTVLNFEVRGLKNHEG